MNPPDLLNKTVARAFYGRFPTLRPAQEAAIESLVAGKNLVLSSGTGSGKTEAVVAPIVSRLWPEIAEADVLMILYIAPTKALVNDIEKRLYPVLNSLGLTVGIRHGDRDDLRSGRTPNVLVTTPESLDVLLFRRDLSLLNIRAVVIDEVHLLYNTQRGLQLSVLLNRLRVLIDSEFQWAALSATVGSLDNVREFLCGDRSEADLLQFPAHRSIDAKVIHIESETAILNLVRKLVSDASRKLLFFVNSRKECDRLASVLSQDVKLAQGIFAHYSSLSAEVRRDSEHQFSVSKLGICIATSTLELGIDIGDIDAVLLWGVPSSVESFLQRIGRSNRRQNKTNVICLITDKSENRVLEAVRFIALIEAAKRSELPKRKSYELFGAISQQFMSVIASQNGSYVRVADLCKLAEHKQYATRPILESILFQLANQGYLKSHGFKNRFGADENLYNLVDYRMIYGNFGASSRDINVYNQSRLLGAVPAINLLRVRSGTTLNFAGKSWRVRKSTIDGIWLMPSGNSTNSMSFVYPGPAPGFDSFLAGEMWQVLHRDRFPSDLLSTPLREDFEREWRRFRNIREDKIPFVRGQAGFCYFTFAGYLVNRAIALLSKQELFTVSDISLTVASPIEWASLPTSPEGFSEIFPQLLEPSLNQSVYQSLLPKELQLREFLQDWLKDEAVLEALQRLSGAEPVQMTDDFRLLSSPC